jgi:hypothetical protein
VEVWRKEGPRKAPLL